MNYFDESSFPTGWTIHRFGEFLTPTKRKFYLEDDKQYQLCGVRWYGQGVFIREHRFGHEIKRKNKYTIKAGDVIYNKLFAWKGSFAIVDSDTDGCCVSDKFPTYELDESLILPAYLKYYFQTEQIRNNATQLSKGVAAASKFTLNPSDLPDLEIPVAPLPEQRRIVSKLNALSMRINQAQQLYLETQEKINALMSSSIGAIISRESPTYRPLESVLTEKLRNGLSLSASTLGNNGILFAQVGIVNTGEFDPQKTKRANITLVSNSPFWMQPGDIFVSRGNALNLVGRAAVYEGTPENCAFPDLLIRVRVNQEKADPKFIAHYFHSPTARSYIESNATGTSPTMKKINQPRLRKLPVPALSTHKQQEIVSYLEKLKTRVNELQTLQDDAKRKLDALLPSVLDKAFRGEL